MVEALRKTYTRDDIIRGGACIEEVDSWCEKKGVYVSDIDEALSESTDEQKEYILGATNRNGYGYGDGNGYGNGDGNGDGYGYGDGDGNGNGNGNGYGYGYGYGDGNGDGYGNGN